MWSFFAPPAHPAVLAFVRASQYLLNFLALEVSGGDYLYVNIGLLVLCVPLLALPIYIMPDRGRGVAWLRRVTGTSSRGLLARPLPVDAADHGADAIHDHDDHDHDGGHHDVMELVPAGPA